MLYGWFSKHAEKANGSCVYATHDGREVVVTIVDDDPNYLPKWKDAVFVGVVTKFIKRNEGPWDFLMLDELGNFDDHIDEDDFYDIPEPPLRPSPQRPCGDSTCACSSTIFDQVSFGRGGLDFNGFWNIPCVVCATDYKRRFPNESVWPTTEDMEGSDEAPV